MTSDAVAPRGHRWVCCGTGPDGAGIVAFSALVPPGWSAEGGLRWDRSSVDPSVTPRFRAWAPDGSADVQLIAAADGAGTRPDPTAFVLAEVLPLLRPRATAIEVVGVGNAAALPWPTAGLAEVLTSVVMVTYLDEGMLWREELTVALGSVPSRSGWSATPGLAIRAWAADYGSWAPQIERIRDSFTVSEPWATALAASEPAHSNVA